jgi:uncharacterized BrkB/YihY/UPF0761 family membrane protein
MRWDRLPLLRHFGDIARATMFPVDLATSKRHFALIYAVRLFFLVGRRLWRDRCPTQAAALSYQTFLSLIPILALVLALGSMFGMAGYIDRVISFLEAQLLPETAADIGGRIREIAGSVRPGALGIAGGAALTALAMTMIFNVDQAVNGIFRCSASPRILTRALTGVVLLRSRPSRSGSRSTTRGSCSRCRGSRPPSCRSRSP